MEELSIFMVDVVEQEDVFVAAAGQDFRTGAVVHGTSHRVVLLFLGKNVRNQLSSIQSYRLTVFMWAA